LVGSAHLITKVYFPRLVIPLASVISALVDLAAASIVLIALLIHYDVRPGMRLIVVPVLLAWLVLTALGVGLWAAALNVRFRDVGHLIPVLLQLWMYVTPVFYGSGLVPAQFRPWLYLNPMATVVDAFRWVLLDTRPPGEATPWTVVASALIVVALFISGWMFYRKTERTFADVV
jgi:lipopolysaccharide transport system permease protein